MAKVEGSITNFNGTPQSMHNNWKARIILKWQSMKLNSHLRGFKRLSQRIKIRPLRVHMQKLASQGPRSKSKDKHHIFLQLEAKQKKSIQHIHIIKGSYETFQFLATKSHQICNGVKRKERTWILLTCTTRVALPKRRCYSWDTGNLVLVIKGPTTKVDANAMWDLEEEDGVTIEDRPRTREELAQGVLEDEALNEEKGSVIDWGFPSFSLYRPLSVALNHPPVAMQLKLWLNHIKIH